MGEEEPVDLMGRAQIHLLKECPSLIWQALRPTWENTMSPYQSEERKGIDQKPCCCCAAMISKASEETGVVAPEDSLVCGTSPAKGVGWLPWVPTAKVRGKGFLLPLSIPLGAWDQRCHCSWSMDTQEPMHRPTDAAQVQRWAADYQLSKALIFSYVFCECQ